MVPGVDGVSKNRLAAGLEEAPLAAVASPGDAPTVSPGTVPGEAAAKAATAFARPVAATSALSGVVPTVAEPAPMALCSSPSGSLPLRALAWAFIPGVLGVLK